MKASIALLISGLAAQQVAATWNRNANHFKTPEYNNNECTDKQKGGFNWDDLKEGDSPGNSYDGNFDFGGWKCKNTFGKRDHLTKRTFGGKSLVHKVSHDKPAKFGCKGKKDGFSPTEYQVSTEYDTDVDLHYKMGDGSTCKQRASCKKEGTTVKNTQCGGAESVEIYIPKGSGKGKGENGKDKEDCEIGFHHIDFDCNPGKEYTPPPAYTPPPKSECGDGYGQKPCKPEQPEEPECGDGYGKKPCKPEQPEEPECGDGEGQTPCEPEQPEEPECGDGEGQTPCEPEQPEEPECGDGEDQEPCKPEQPEEPECGDDEGQTPCEPEQPEKPDSPPYPPTNSTSPPPPPGTTAPPAETPDSPPPSGCGDGYGQKPCESAPTAPPATETPGSTAPPATETPGSTAPPATETPGSYPPSGPSSPPEAPGSYPPSGPSSPPEAPGSYPPSGPSSAPETPTSSQVSPEQPAPSYPAPPAGGYTPPEVLPSCINTWLQVNTQCKDNTDSECYCKIPDFTDNVLACVAAHGTEEEQSEAVQYFIGICAPAVPENPGIVTNCPTQIPINPTPAPSAPAPGAPAPSAPAGEVPTTAVAPGAPAPSAPAPSAPAPSYPVTTVEAGSSTYTVPQVGFTTVAPDAPGANPTEPIALYPGVTPAPAPAVTTGAGAAPYPTGPSGLTSVVAPTGTAAPSTPGLPEFEGAASPLNIQLKGALFGGAVLAFFAL